MIEALGQLHFLRPHWLLLLLPAALMLALLLRRGAQEGDWTRAVAPELLTHLLDGQQRARSRRLLFLLAIGWVLASFAAAGPSWNKLPRPVLQKQDALIIIMDMSYSMLATDLQPSRVDRLRRKVQDLLGQRREGLSGLVAYAGDAHVVAPLTDDNRTIANLLPALDPSMMPLPGSNPADAMELALELFQSAGVRSGRMLLLTDGIEARDQEEISALLQDSAHRLAILGVGTDVGAPIPLPGGGFLKDEAGEIVVPALTERPLRDLASAASGAYRAMEVGDGDLKALLDATASVLDNESIARDREADEWQDMAHWFVLPLLLACLFAFRRGYVYGFVLLFALPAADTRATIWDDLWLRRDQQGVNALSAGDAARAVELFENPSWRGTAAYQQGDYEAALESFQRGSDADQLYNRGNALAAQGRLEEAISAYEKSLELQPGSEDAQTNIETLKDLLEQQQQEQQQNQQQQQQQNQSSDGQQDNQGGQSQQDSGSPQDSQREPGDEQSQDPAEGDPQQDQSGDEPGESQQGQQSEESEAGEEGQPTPMSPQIDNSAMQESLERDQALQQWLRRVPDDPSGLLREKFRYESRRRQQQGDTRRSEKIW